MIVMETACLQTVEIYYCGGFVPLFVTMCHGLSSFILTWINTCVISIDIVPVVIRDYPVG